MMIVGVKGGFMYIYESHLGGLYTSDEALDYDYLYCEECGDSDTEVGYFQDDDFEGIWDTIKPFDLACIGCKDCTDNGECEMSCELLLPYTNCNCYGLLYSMKFIEEIQDGKKSYVYLICKDADTGKIFVNFKPYGHKFGECQTIPSSFCYKQELELKVAYSLIPPVEKIIKEPEFIKKVSQKNRGCSVYECIVKKEKDEEENAAWYYNDGWYGWTDRSEYIPVDNEVFVKEIVA